MAQLRTQKLAIAVGAVVGALATLAVLAVLVVLVGGRDEKRHVSARPVPRGRVIYTLRSGDVVRDPLTATRCEASGEGGHPNLFCTRMRRGRYQIVFYSDEVQVFDLLDPNEEPLEAKYVFKWIAHEPIRVHAK
jgi:hypothetical protein